MRALATTWPRYSPALDAAEMVASRIGEIDGAAIALIRPRMGGKLERETIRTALDEAMRSRR